MPRNADTNPYLPPTEIELQADTMRRIVDTMSDDEVADVVKRSHPARADSQFGVTLSQSAEELELRKRLTTLQDERDDMSLTIEPLIKAGIFTVEEIGRAVADGTTRLAEELNNLPVDIAATALDIPGFERFINRYVQNPLVSAGALGIDETLMEEYYRNTDEMLAEAFPEFLPPPGRSVTRRMAERAYYPHAFAPPETGAGQLLSSLVEFTGAMALAGVVSQAVVGNAIATETAAGRMLTLSGSFFLTPGPEEESLSRIMELSPVLQEPIRAYLEATDDDASAMLRRLRAAGDGLLLGAAFEPFVKSMQLYRVRRISRREASRALLRQLGRTPAMEAGERAAPGFAERTAAEKTLSAAEIETERVAALKAGKPRGGAVTPDEAGQSLEARFQRRVRESISRPAASRLGEVHLDARKNLLYVADSEGNVAAMDRETLAIFEKELDAMFAANRQTFRATTTDIELSKLARQITTEQLLLKLDPSARQFSFNAPQARALRMRMQILDDNISALAHLLNPEAETITGLTDTGLAELFRLANLRLAFEARFQRGISEAGRTLREAGAFPEGAVNTLARLFTASERKAQSQGFASAMQRRIASRELSASARRETLDLIQQAGGRKQLTEMLQLYAQLGDNDIKQLMFWSLLSGRERTAATIRFAFFQSTLSGMASLKAAVGNTIFTAQLGVERSVGMLIPAYPTKASPEFLTRQGSIAYFKGLLSGMSDGYKLFTEVLIREDFQQVVGGSRLGGQAASRGINPIRAMAGKAKLSDMPFADQLARALSIIAYAAETPTRVLVGIDEATGAVVKHAVLTAQATDRAAILGLRGQQAKSYILSTVLSPLPADEARAALRGAQAGLRQQPTPLPLQRLLQLADSHVALNLLMPYMRPQINLFANAMERTPFAILAPTVLAELRAGGARSQEAWAKIITGTVIMGELYQLATEGKLYGHWPDASRLTKTGGVSTAVSHTIEINGEMHAYLPDSTVFKLAEVVADFVHHGQSIDPQSQEANELLGAAFGLSVMLVTEQVDMQATANLIAMARKGRVDIASESVSREFESAVAGTTIPGFFRLTAGQIFAEEPHVRRMPENFVERIDMAFGGIFGPNMAFPHVALNGESVPAVPGYMGLAFDSVPYISTAKDQLPWARELQRITMTQGVPPAVVPSAFFASAVRMTPEERWFFHTLAGQGAAADGIPSFASVITPLLTEPDYIKAPDFEKSAMWSNELAPQRKGARAVTLQHFAKLYPKGHPLSPEDRILLHQLIRTGDVPEQPIRSAPTNLESFGAIVGRFRERFGDPEGSTTSAAPVVQ